MSVNVVDMDLQVVQPSLSLSLPAGVNASRPVRLIFCGGAAGGVADRALTRAQRREPLTGRERSAAGAVPLVVFSPRPVSMVRTDFWEKTQVFLERSIRETEKPRLVINLSGKLQPE